METRPPGRPPAYSPEVADAICARLADGESLREICRDEGMPDRRTVYRWADTKPEFAKQLAQARLAQADHVDDLIAELAESVTPDTAQADKVRLAALTWRASKLNPRRYGDKVSQEITGTNGEPLTVRWQHEITDLERAKALALLVERTKRDQAETSIHKQVGFTSDRAA